MNWREKMAARGAEMAFNAMAGAATLVAVAAGGEKMRKRLAENPSDDVEGSDEETEDIWNSTTDSAMPTTPSATAISIRNQPAVDFLKMVDEERITAELKDAKNLRKKLREIKKWMKKSIKSGSTFSEANESTVAALHAATDEHCTDPIIIDLTTAAETRLHEVNKFNALSNFTTHITDQIVEKIKPINDHTKMISVTGKEWRAARNRRVRIALEEVGVTSEEAYNKSAELVRDFEEKDRTYRDVFINFREENSSQLGQMLRYYLLETATYLENVAKAMREAAGGTANNCYLSSDCSTKFKDFAADLKSLLPIPPLFPNIDPSHDVEDRLTATPQPAAAETVFGIPMAESADGAEGQSGYCAFAYTRYKDNARGRRSIDNFLLIEQLPSSEASRMTPQPRAGRSPNTDGSPEKHCGDAPPAFENSRAQPASTFETASTTKSPMDYIHSLAGEYGIEPDFSVRRNGDGRRSRRRRRQHRRGGRNARVTAAEHSAAREGYDPGWLPRSALAAWQQSPRSTRASACGAYARLDMTG